MRNTLLKLASFGVATSLLAVSAPAFADEAPAADTSTSAFTLTGSVAVVSDYRFRGVSLNGKKIALQPTLTLKHESGLYAGVWGSNVSPNGGQNIETDVYAGFAGGDDITYDIGGTFYLYPSATGLNYYELTGKLGKTVGPVQLGAQLSYVPKQTNTGSNDNIYVGTNAAVGVPNTPITLTGSVGYEDGAFGNKKVDWSLGASAVVSGFTLGVSYVDADTNSVFALNDAKAGAVFSISYGF